MWAGPHPIRATARKRGVAAQKSVLSVNRIAETRSLMWAGPHPIRATARKCSVVAQEKCSHGARRLHSEDLLRLTSTMLAILSAVATPALLADDTSSAPANNNKTTFVSQTATDEFPLVIAHRGASGYLPEHTTEAAAFAHALGADYIEQDVVLSKDGTAVVLHDVTLDSVTNVEDVFPGRDRDGKFYAFDFTLAELRQLNVNERITDKERGRFPNNIGRFGISTLSEHIELIQGLNHSRGRNAGLYVEIKKPALHREHELDPSKEVLRVLREYGYEKSNDRVFIQCFEEDEVVRIRTELKCRLPLIQLLSRQPTPEKIAEYGRIVDGLGVATSTVITGVKDGEPQITDLVKRAHEHAMNVHVWTFRTDALPAYAESSDELLNWLVLDAGVDGIFTDQPDAVYQWRQKMPGRSARQGPFHLLHSEKK